MWFLCRGRPTGFPALLALFLLLPSAPAWAQTGTITGVVVDAETGETLIGANVVLDGTTIGSTTDLDGRYTIPGVDPGQYAVRFSYIGYQPKTVQGVAVRAGKVARVDLELAAEALEVGEVVVEARALENTDAALLAQRAKAAGVSDAVSAEAISRSGSSTAADAMGRVTGASVVGGKYVYVRGLGDRYMSTQLNGATLPSADPDRNAVPLDLFPSSALDNIITTKSFTPDKPGSFAGGNIDISTKAFPERFTFSISSKVGYHSVATGSDAFMTFQGGSVGRFADGASRHAVPAAWAERSADAEPVLDVVARFDEAKAAELNELSRAFNAVMAPTAAIAPVDRSFSLSTGNQVQLLGRPLGFVGGVSYDHSYALYTQGTYGEYKLTGAVSSKKELDTQALLAETQGREEVLVGGLGTVSYRLAPEHTVSSTVIYNRSGEARAHYGYGALQRDLPTGTVFETRAIGYTERMLQSLQLLGEHYFAGLAGLRAEWTAARTSSTQDVPDLRFFANQYTVRERDGNVDTLYAIRTSNYTAPSRYFRYLQEDAWESHLDLALPFGTAGGPRGTVEVGGAYNTRDRVFDERLFMYRLNPSTAEYRGDPAAFFSSAVGVLDTAITSAGSKRFTIGNYVQDVSTPANSYRGDQQVYATYAMIDVRPVPRLRVITGVRFEATRMEVASRDETKPAGRIDENDWLPSLNLVYELRGDLNLRAAYGRTLARPLFREKAPYSSFDFIGGRILIGNPELERTLIDNLDARLEWFPRPGEILAVSGFYKRMQHPIELAILSTNNQVQYQNVERATVFGVELEARKRLGALAGLLAPFELGGNLSIVQSTVDIPADDLVEIRALDPHASAERSLQGQSPYMLNVDLTYFDPKAGTTASVLYNVFGRRLSEVAIGGSPNIYEAASGTLDLVVSQPLLMGFDLKLSARNLLDADYRRVQRFKGQDYVVQQYDRGRSITLGVTYAVD